MFSGGLFAGRIFDSHGPRWLLLFGSCLFILCFFIIPECKVYWQLFLAQGVAFGISISTMYPPQPPHPNIHTNIQLRYLFTIIVPFLGFVFLSLSLFLSGVY